MHCQCYLHPLVSLQDFPVEHATLHQEARERCDNHSGINDQKPIQSSNPLSGHSGVNWRSFWMHPSSCRRHPLWHEWWDCHEMLWGPLTMRVLDMWYSILISGHATQLNNSSSCTLAKKGVLIEFFAPTCWFMIFSCLRVYCYYSILGFYCGFIIKLVFKLPNFLLNLNVNCALLQHGSNTPKVVNSDRLRMPVSMCGTTLNSLISFGCQQHLHLYIRMNLYTMCYILFHQESCHKWPF